MWYAHDCSFPELSDTTARRGPVTLTACVVSSWAVAHSTGQRVTFFTVTVTSVLSPTNMRSVDSERSQRKPSNARRATARDKMYAKKTVYSKTYNILPRTNKASRANIHMPRRHNTSC